MTTEDNLPDELGEPSTATDIFLMKTNAIRSFQRVKEEQEEKKAKKSFFIDKEEKKVLFAKLGLIDSDDSSIEDMNTEEEMDTDSEEYDDPDDSDYVDDDSTFEE